MQSTTLGLVAENSDLSFQDQRIEVMKYSTCSGVNLGQMHYWHMKHGWSSNVVDLVESRPVNVALCLLVK